MAQALPDGVELLRVGLAEIQAALAAAFAIVIRDKASRAGQRIEVIEVRLTGQHPVVADVVAQPDKAVGFDVIGDDVPGNRFESAGDAARAAEQIGEDKAGLPADGIEDRVL